MNKQSKKENWKNFIRLLILVIVVNGLSARAYAQTSAAADSLRKQIEVKYLGSAEDMMLIGVNYNNVTNSRFTLSIYNEEGEVLYRNVYNSTELHKKFMIPKMHRRVNFVFSGSNNKISRTYRIHNTSRMVEDVEVTKL